MSVIYIVAKKQSAPSFSLSFATSIICVSRLYLITENKRIRVGRQISKTQKNIKKIEIQYQNEIREMFLSHKLLHAALLGQLNMSLVSLIIAKVEK